MIPGAPGGGGGGFGDTGNKSSAFGSRQLGPGGLSLPGTPRPSNKASPSRAKKKSAIPKLAKRSSVIYSGGVLGPPVNGKTVNGISNGGGNKGRASTSLGSFRVPWVPAPGKSSAVFPPNSEPELSPMQSNGGGEQNVNEYNEDYNSSSNSAFLSSSSSVNSFSHKSASNQLPPPVPARRRSSQVQTNASTSTISGRDNMKIMNQQSGTEAGAEGDNVDDKIKKSSSGPSEESSDAKANNFSSLKSKDSLMQITTFLQEKRDEILHLWQENLTNETTSEELLQQFEKANMLALEAAKQVESLRKSIQSLQTKESSLSSEEVDLLDDLRNSVLDKVKAFEETNSKVYQMIGAASAATASATKSKSRVLLVPSKSSASTLSDQQPTVVFKGSNKGREDEDSTDEEVTYLKDPSNFVSNVNSKTASTAASTMDLSRLAQMYAEEYDINPIMTNASSKTIVGGHHSRPSVVSSKQTLSRGGRSSLRFGKEKRHHSRRETSCIPSETSCSSDQVYEEQRRSKLYKAKISSLQRQLQNTEVEMEELRNELERVESDSNFQVKMLRSSFQDKLEEVEACPPVAPINNSYFDVSRQASQVHGFHSKNYRVPYNLQRELEERDREIERLKEDNHKSQTEIRDIQSKLRSVEGTRDQLVLKIADLNQINGNMRRELDQKTVELAILMEKFESLKIQAEKSWNSKVNSSSSSNSMRELRATNEKLEEEIRDLKSCLSKAKKNVEVLQNSKRKMSARQNKRQEELLEELEKARMRNRRLQNQIHHLRTTYQDLFPPDLFHPSHQSLSPSSRIRSSQSERKSQPHRDRHSTAGTGKKLSKTVIFGIDGNYSSVEEPIVTKTQAWTTGKQEAKECETAVVDTREIIDAISTQGEDEDGNSSAIA